jgi:hypothetical protein
MPMNRATRRSLFPSRYPVDQVLGVVASGALFVHPYDGVVGFTVTTMPTGSSVQFRLRQLDGNNHWRWSLAATGILSQDEIVASAATAHGASASGAVTVGARIVIVLDGPNLSTYVNGVIVSALTYASAVNFQYEVVGKLQQLGTGGVISDIRTWKLNARQMEGV